MSMGWMTQVASIPEAPPLTKGLIVGHTLLGFDFSSPISKCESDLGERKREWTERKLQRPVREEERLSI